MIPYNGRVPIRKYTRTKINKQKSPTTHNTISIGSNCTPQSSLLSSSAGIRWGLGHSGSLLVARTAKNRVVTFFPAPLQTTQMQSRAERGLTLMHATPVAASQVEDEASPLLMCASASFSLFQTEELVPRLGFVVSWSRSLSSLLDWYFTHRGMEYLLV